MKHLICAVGAIALVTPVAGMAQQPDKGHDRNRPQHSEARPAKPQQQNGPRRQVHQQHQGRQDQQARQVRPDEQNRARVSTVTRSAQVNHQAGERTRRVSNNVYRIGHRPTSFHRVRASTFHYPRGYHYQRFGIGSMLPRLFLSSLYFWSDYGSLGLGAPPPGYVWVRYGPDLLLVNRYTGRIADVIYGAFY
jgi:Ni/Co efflux regulator RcnB